MELKRASTEQFDFAEKLLNKKIKPQASTAAEQMRKKHFQAFINSGAFAEISKKFDPFWDKAFEVKGQTSKSNFDDVTSTRKFKGPFDRLQALFELLSTAANKQYKELLGDEKLSKVKDKLESYLGGIDNALNTQIGLAILALQKVAMFCGENKSKLPELLETVFETNRHIATQFGNLHMAVLQLVENASGIIPNQLQIYQFEANNFELAKSPDLSDDKVYLLPTMDFLDKVVRLSEDPKTTLEVHRQGGNLINPFKDIHQGPVMGCPLFRSTKDFAGNEVKLEDWFFNTITTFIKGSTMPFPKLVQAIRDIKGSKRLALTKPKKATD